VTSPAQPADARVLGSIGLTILTCAFFAAMGTTSQFVVLAGVPVVVSAWGRYVFQSLLTTAVVLPLRGRRVLQTRHLPFQLLRGGLLVTGTLLFFTSLKYMQVGELTAIILLAPVIVTMAGPALFKEQVAPSRWALVLTAFAGTLIIIRPGGSGFSWVMLLPLAQAVVNGAFQMVTSKLARTEDPLTTHFYTGWIGAITLTLVLPYAWTGSPTPENWLLIALMGIFGGVGHFVMVLAFRHVAASTLMPYMYSQIGFAVLFGWLVRGHVPDHWSLIGMAVIAACGVASAWLSVRESRRA
jgi:drug/metabolite transporter (DMT)-like permease